jgi:glycosyltransferase involved in cell wall biosynthesis
VKGKNIKILHFIDLKSTIVGGITSFFLKNIKTVATVHGLPEKYHSLFLNTKYNISLIIYFLLLRHFVDSVICVSRDLEWRLQEIIGAKKLTVIHNGINFQTKDDTVMSPIFQKANQVIGTVGRLSEVKGHRFFIEAAKRILKYRNDVIFYIIGSGPLETSLREQAAAEGLDDKIYFLGFRKDATALIKEMTVFVLPSLHEGIPYVLLEAMSASKSVVCTEVGGIKEVIDDKIHGLLVPSRNVKALSRAILSLLNNSEYRTQLGRNARKRVEAQFSSELMAKKTQALYSGLVEDWSNKI